MSIPNRDDEDLGPQYCPECGAYVIEKWSGAECSECDWWFCY